MFSLFLCVSFVYLGEGRRHLMIMIIIMPLQIVVLLLLLLLLLLLIIRMMITILLIIMTILSRSSRRGSPPPSAARAGHSYCHKDQIVMLLAVRLILAVSLILTFLFILAKRRLFNWPKFAQTPNYKVPTLAITPSTARTGVCEINTNNF